MRSVLTEYSMYGWSNGRNIRHHDYYIARLQWFVLRWVCKPMKQLVMQNFQFPHHTVCSMENNGLVLLGNRALRVFAQGG